MSHLLELVAEADRDRNGKIDFDEWQIMGARVYMLFCSKTFGGANLRRSSFILYFSRDSLHRSLHV